MSDSEINDCAPESGAQSIKRREREVVCGSRRGTVAASPDALSCYWLSKPLYKLTKSIICLAQRRYKLQMVGPPSSLQLEYSPCQITRYVFEVMFQPIACYSRALRSPIEPSLGTVTFTLYLSYTVRSSDCMKWMWCSEVSLWQLISLRHCCVSPDTMGPAGRPAWLLAD